MAVGIRVSLQRVALAIAANQHRTPTRPLVSLRKLFIQERRDWGRPGAPQVGWKRGELIEFVLAPSDEEWGDVGYYVAQTWSWLWWLYATITPRPIIARAVEKFAARAERRENVATIVCDRCSHSIEHDVAADGLPEYWAQFPFARSGEEVVYTASDGRNYTSGYSIGNAAEDRPHVCLCPTCHAELFPWV